MQFFLSTSFSVYTILSLLCIFCFWIIALQLSCVGVLTFFQECEDDKKPNISSSYVPKGVKGNVPISSTTTGNVPIDSTTTDWWTVCLLLYLILPFSNEWLLSSMFSFSILLWSWWCVTCIVFILGEQRKVMWASNRNARRWSGAVFC